MSFQHPSRALSGERTGMSRRQFISAACVAGGALGALGVRPVQAAESSLKGGKTSDRGFIDTNVTLGQWPMRRLPLDEPAALLKALRKNGVTQAWVGSFEGLLHRDLAGVNQRLAQMCRADRRNFWVPFGSVDPASSGWEEDLRLCQEVHGMRGVRLFPGYHGYGLSDPVFGRFLDALQARRMILQVVVTIEDARVRHPRMEAAPVDLKPLVAHVASRRELKVMLLNWNRGLNAAVVPSLASTGRVWLDIATVEGVGGVEALMSKVGPETVVFGSHAPYYYFESALLKLQESDLSQGDLAHIRYANASRLLG